MNENKMLPTGWGSDDDDDYGFNSEDDESSAWGNSSSPFKKTDEESEKVNPPAAQSGNYESQSNLETSQPMSSRSHVAGLQKDVNSPVSAHSSFGVTPSKSKAVPILIAVIALLLVIVGILSGMFFMKNKKDKSDKYESTVSNDTAITDTSLLTSVTTTTLPDITETDETTNIQTEIHQENKIISETVFSCSKDEVNSKYLEIISGMDFAIPHRGFMTDLNGDEVNEMIVPEVSDMIYKLYYYDGGSVKSCSFGSFMALSNFEMFSVDGDDGKKYIYYRDNYSYKSRQGYFSLYEMSEIDILINFPNADSGTADWKISYNETEQFAEGTDNVSKIYGETKNCYEKILDSFKKYGFGISDSSKYNSIDGLYYDDLVKELERNSTQDPQKTTAPEATASISVEPQSINGNGTCLLITVGGNYSYYTYEIYADCEGERNTLRKSGTSYDKSYTYEDGSTVSNFVFYVTPYNADGIAGERASINYNGALSLPPSNVSSITSCNKYGTIYSPSGTKVNGLARSYLIDGGAATYERYDLTHGWHVTAVNQYFDGSTYWYELYDSDDGDYYGWVSEESISFY